MVNVATSRVTDYCLTAKEAERRGEFEVARALLRPRFERVGIWPDLSGLTTSESAEFLLRVASVSGQIGHEQQITESQSFSRALSREARNLFADNDKQAECLNVEALSHWREGKFNQAAVLWVYALSLVRDDELRANLLTNQVMNEWGRGNLDYSIWLSSGALTFVESIGSPFCKTRFFTNRAVALKKKADIAKDRTLYDQAISNYLAAIVFADLAGHAKGRAYCELNLGNIYFEVGSYMEAHEQFNNAANYFNSVKDFGTLAQLNETRSRLLSAEGKHNEADKLICSVIRTLETGDERLLLAEALETRAKIIRASVKGYAEI